MRATPTPADRDAKAAERDLAADARDAAQDAGPRSGYVPAERLHAAADRAASREDRRAAAQDRDSLHQAAEDRTEVGQAQGLLMASRGIDAEAARALLAEEAQARDVNELALAQEHVTAHEDELPR